MTRIFRVWEGRDSVCGNEGVRPGRDVVEVLVEEPRVQVEGDLRRRVPEVWTHGINDLATSDISATQVADHARKFLARLRDTGVTAFFLLVANHAGKRDVDVRQVALTGSRRRLRQSLGHIPELLGCR